MSRLPVILNPTAGGGRLLRHRAELERVARASGVELRWVPTDHPGHAETLARGEADRGAPIVFAFGGDGTYNEVARGLIGSDSALGVLPGGTTSVLAYELGVPRPAPRALACLLLGDDRALRPGRTDRGDLFLLMLSAGPDTVVLSSVDSRLKKHGGRVGIALTAIRELVGRRPMPRLCCDSGDGEMAAGWVIVGRSRCYAGPFHATPGASLFDDSLEVVLQRGVGRRAAARFALALALGRHLACHDVVRLRSRSLRLASADGRRQVPYQVDGDLELALPVEIGVADEVLRLRLPG